MSRSALSEAREQRNLDYRRRRRHEREQARRDGNLFEYWRLRKARFQRPPIAAEGREG